MGLQLAPSLALPTDALAPQLPAEVEAVAVAVTLSALAESFPWDSDGVSVRMPGIPSEEPWTGGFGFPGFTGGLLGGFGLPGLVTGVFPAEVVVPVSWAIACCELIACATAEANVPDAGDPGLERAVPAPVEQLAPTQAEMLWAP